MKKKKISDNIIASNRKARHDYTIQETMEAGLVLEGWEVKSMREGRVQLKDSYVMLKEGEAWLIGAHISPLSTASTHIQPDPTRSRKLLLHRRELSKLFTAIQTKGCTAVALDCHWTRRKAKTNIGIAKGKKTYDKRESLKQKDLDREQRRALKH